MTRKIFGKSFLRDFMLLFLIAGEIIFSQIDPQTQKYRNEPLGDKTYRKKGIMDGNLIRTIFRNDGQVGTWESGGYPGPSGEWPKGTGHNYIDGVTPMVGSAIVAPGNGQLIHPIIGSYREEVDFDPVTNELWVAEPVPGYAAPASEEPAINTKPLTWPEQWPRALPLIDPSWDGYWFGYFGRGVQNADVETFYVMDDSKDKEFTRLPYNYYPVASDNDRGGLGLRVEVRGFQWSHVLAEDIIFWHFDIVNLSDFNYDTTYFGFYCDTGVGGINDNADDNASYSTKLDIAYAFDNDGKAPPDNWPTGYVGYAYLESPGNSFNNFDDDEDGLTDEKRDDGIDNDGDWIPYLDINGNGVWDADQNEPLNNDVGKDGVGPFDPQYISPDEGEGDGIPTLGEPNFDTTDKDESDQIGLTSLSIYRLAGKGPTDGWLKNDEVMWRKMNYASFDTALQNSNISLVFGSGPFPLKLNKRERFSMALVFGSNLEDLIFNKETVQQIYNANYNFAKPPYKATLTAVAGDKKVFLYWNSISEESRDPFLGYQDNDPTKGYKKDFEGYLLYRSQEPEFNDIKIITDSKGEPKYWKPIAQFDLNNGINGPDPIGINGARFWRGDDTGLQHSYIDTNVVNGNKYYYALVAYDQGDPNFGTKGLIPSETTKIISEDLTGTIKFVDINCAVVVPNSPAAGYQPAQIEGELNQVASGIGTGKIDVEILNPNIVEEGTEYKILFKSTGQEHNYRTASYSIIKTKNGVIDTLESAVDSTNIGTGKFSPPFEGLTVSAINDNMVAFYPEKSGWLVGNSTVVMYVIPDTSTKARNIAWPADYQIEWFGSEVDVTPITRIGVPFKITNLVRNEQVQAEVFDNNRNNMFDLNDDILIVEYVGEKIRANAKYTWRIGYYNPFGQNVVEPVAGDKFILTTRKPFRSGDYFTFSTKASKVDQTQANSELSKILLCLILISALIHGKEETSARPDEAKGESTLFIFRQSVLFVYIQFPERW